jgi:hypothetical protein
VVATDCLHLAVGWYGQDVTAIPECHASSNRRVTEPALITWRRPLSNARCRIST